MLEAKGNMLDYLGRVSALVVTTNGFVKSNGECVMGRGIAKQIAELDPSIPRVLGTLLKSKGNNVHFLGHIKGTAIFSFPVKPVSKQVTSEQDVVRHMRKKWPVGTLAQGWGCVADPNIIKRSAVQLQAWMDANPDWQHWVCPRFGCGAGELSWDTVKPMVASILCDKAVAMTF